MKKRSNIGIGMKIVLMILLLEIVVMGAIIFVGTNAIIAGKEESTLDNMKNIVQERSQLIDNYVVSMENTLTAYSRAGEITALLKNPTDEKIFAAAQAYTEKFSGDIANLEGIYASEWNTHVLTHTNSKVVGITTRKAPEPLKALQDAMLSSDGVYNTGFIISPASGLQTLSMYRAVFDERNQPIGLVGAGIFSGGIIKTLDELDNYGMENARYCLVNAKTKQYIFCPEEEKVMTEVEEYYAKVCDAMIAGADKVGSITYREDGITYIGTYCYMEEYDWLFILTDDVREVYAEANALGSRLAIICIIGLALLVLITFFVITRLLRPMKAIERALVELQNYDISEKTEISKYTKRRDELGNISKATASLVKALQDIAETLQDSCTDLDQKTEELGDTAFRLVENVTDNVATTQELLASLENTNGVVSNVTDEVDSVNSAVSEIYGSVQESIKAGSMASADTGSMEQKASRAYEESKTTIEETRKSVETALEKLNSLSNINVLASEILNISAQTNLLSLNASIEAARAGEAGRGFSVVAGEIGSLADTSKNTASEIQNLCNEANESIRTVTACFEGILKFIDEDMLQQFAVFAKDAGNCKHTVDDMMAQIENIGRAITELKDATLQISENITVVNSITGENHMAVSSIVEKNEETAVISDTIQSQSANNKQLALQLSRLLSKFSKK